MVKIRGQNTIDFLLASAAIASGISYGPIYLFHIALASYFIIGILRPSVPTLQLPRPRRNFHLLFIVWPVYYLLLVPISPDTLVALRYSLYVITGSIVAGIMIVYVQDRSSLERFLWIIGVLFAVEAAIALAEILTPFRYPLSPFSPLTVYFGKSMKVLTELQLRILEFTPTGWRWNPNNLALTFLIVLPYVATAERLLWRVVLTIACFVVILATNSRSATLVSLLELAILVSLSTSFRVKFPKFFAITWLVGAAIALILGSEEPREFLA